MHKIASANEHTLEFVSSLGDSVAVKLTTNVASSNARAMRVQTSLTAHLTDSGRECCWQNILSIGR
jgi:hypothetical protein